jgi:hypothetical protein
MPTETPAPSAFRRLDGLSALLLGAFVFLARAWLIERWGSAVPFWDQWDAEALSLYRPWLTDSLRWMELFAAHNEHRIVLTRLADLVLLECAGSWNPWWQMLLNAALHALSATALFLVMRPSLKDSAHPTALAGLALLFAVPTGWQNALWGFQSQVYFGNLLALLALAGLAAGPPFYLRWWLGWLSGLLAFFANGAGLLVAIAALPVVALSLGFRGAPTRHTLIPLLVVLALLPVGWMLHADIPHHDYLRAKDWSGFLTVALHGLSWPWVNSLWAWLPLQAPAVWLMMVLIKTRRRPDASERFLLGLAFWAMLQAAAIAWSRGAGLPDGRPLSRYQDPLLLGAAASFLILVRLITQHPRARIAGLLWGGCLLAGLLTLSTHVLTLNLPFKRQQDATGLAQIHAYLATRDSRVFVHAPGAAPLHPNSVVVQQVLDDPVLRPVLPVGFFDPTARPPAIVIHAPWLTLLALAGLLIPLGLRAVSGSRRRNRDQASQSTTTQPGGRLAGNRRPDRT